jgi:hypothetical protein
MDVSKPLIQVKCFTYKKMIIGYYSVSERPYADTFCLASITQEKIKTRTICGFLSGGAISWSAMVDRNRIAPNYIRVFNRLFGLDYSRSQDLHHRGDTP